MSAEQQIIKLMSDHKNWFPAAYHDRMTDRNTMRHSLEISFGERANQQDIDRMKGAFKSLQDEGIIDQKFEIFQYSQPKCLDSKNETGYLVVFTTSAKALNAMTKSVKAPMSGKMLDAPVDSPAEQKRWLDARSFGRIASHAGDLERSKHANIAQPCYVFGNSETYRDGEPLAHYILQSKILENAIRR